MTNDDRGAYCGIAQPNPRFERGLEALRRRDPETVARLRTIGEVAPDFAAYLVEYALGDIAARPGLDPKLQALSAVAMVSALGVSRELLASEIRTALALGWTPPELMELMLQLSIYAGYPAAIRALEVLDEASPGA